MVSIIIPCFRQGAMLPTAINSALAQTHAAVEVVVVNDGSDDDTDAVARSYGTRIRYVSQKNGGLSAARNAGVAVATGKFLHFLDSDDAIHPEAIERLVAASATLEYPLVMMGWRMFETDPDAPIGEPQLPPEQCDAVTSLLTALYGPPLNFLSSRAMFERIGGFDESMSGCADWDFWLRQLFAGAVPVSLPFVGAYYRTWPGQMSRHQIHMQEELARTIGQVAARLGQATRIVREWGLSPDILRKEFRARAAREFGQAGYQRRECGEFWKAAKHYWRSARFGNWWSGAAGLVKLPAHLATRSALRLLRSKPSA